MLIAMTVLHFVWTVYFTKEIKLVDSNYASGDIDNPSNINGKRVYIFNGQVDEVVNVGMSALTSVSGRQP